MGKAEQVSDNVPGLSPQTEASKLLEQALMQMDGIISGNTSSLTAHSPDYGFASSPPGVREAASSLATAIQNTPGAPPPDPAVAKVLMLWMQQRPPSSVEEPPPLPPRLQPSAPPQEYDDFDHHWHPTTNVTQPMFFPSFPPGDYYNNNASSTSENSGYFFIGGVNHPNLQQHRQPPPPPPPTSTPLMCRRQELISVQDPNNVNCSLITPRPPHTSDEMRELCKGGGAVVAAVVAVLEKQQNQRPSPPHHHHHHQQRPLNGSLPRPPPSSSGLYSSSSPSPVAPAAKNTETRPPATYRGGSSTVRAAATAADANFQSAVEDFDSVAEDVEKIIVLRQTDSLKRAAAASSKTAGFRGASGPAEGGVGLGDCDGGDGGTCGDTGGYLKFQKRGIGGTPRRRDVVASDGSVDLLCSSSEEVEEEEYSSSEEGSSETESSSSSSSSSSDDSEREHVIGGGDGGGGSGGGLATIAEEDRNTPSSTYKGLKEEEDDESSHEDDTTTVKSSSNNNIWQQSGNCSTIISNGSISNGGSTSDVSTTSSERPRSLRDSSTRCNDDFQWIRKDVAVTAQPPPPYQPPPIALPACVKMEESAPPLTKPPISTTRSSKSTSHARREKTAPGSLDRRRPHGSQSSRLERDQKSRSTHSAMPPQKSPPRLDDFAPCQNWCCAPPPPPSVLHEQQSVCYENFHRRHERMDPQRYGSSPMLMERGSHPDLYGGGYNMGGCCGGYHGPPPCCFYGDRSYHWTPPYPKPINEQDEKFRKLQYEKDNLQLQVQVLSEQIEAQGDKISDLEKILGDRKQQLSDAEDKLQREVLSRSSLETQKLELMSIMSELKLQQAALERENHELRCHFNNNPSDGKKPPLVPRLAASQSSTPIHHSSSQGLNLRMSPSPSPVILTGSSPRRIDSSSSSMIHQQEAQSPKTPPANYKRQIDVHYGSLPRQQFLSNGSGGMVVAVCDSNANPAAAGGASNGLKKGVAFADTEKIVIEDGTVDSSQSSVQFGKNKGIKKIFGRMKRSGSGNLEELPGVGEFQRGGVRATAAARLGWSEPQLSVKPDKPFVEWDTENICDWLQDLGLDQYVSEAKRWVKTGQQLQETPIHEIEKELSIKNPLHKKKLQLALIDTQENGSSDPFLSQAGQLDTAWVLRWLDDTGLPQHKENFLINRVDGRVLHRLTVDDLAMLHVSSMLHVASIKRGIQVLRENGYEPGCLQRRSLPDDLAQPLPKQIALWTTHRVMEWLRAVDLAEYAPNLRGAGVHGGLMVYETKFTAELLASLLSIPPGKTLLRRHLNTHFKELLGKDIIQDKREAEATMGYIPLTPSSKLKVAKKSQFSLKRKKSKGEADYGDLVCPLNPDKQSGELNGSALNMGMMKMDGLEVEGVSHQHAEQKLVRSSPASIANSPIPQRHV